MGKHDLSDPRRIDKRNAQYLIEGLAVAFEIDPNLFKREVEVNYQTHNLRYLFEQKKKRRFGKKTGIFAFVSAITLILMFYVRYTPFQIGFSLLFLIFLQVFAVTCVIIAVIWMARR